MTKRRQPILKAMSCFNLQISFFASLEIISNAYYPVIEEMDKSKDEISALLRQKTTKKRIFFAL